MFEDNISNFFNSICVEDFFSILPNEIKRNRILYNVLQKIYQNPFVIENGVIKKPQKGLMAGCATTPFLTNIYLKELDDYFTSKKITYCRYSDDIIIFDTKDNIDEHFRYIQRFLAEKKLKINEQKTLILPPASKWTFLGFSFINKKIDISAVSFEKMKQKIKRMTVNTTKISRMVDLQRRSFTLLYKKNYRKIFGNTQKPNDLCWLDGIFRYKHR